MSAAHGTNLDGVWVRANEARLLNKGAVFKFGASSREYKVQPSPKGLGELSRSVCHAPSVNLGRRWVLWLQLQCASICRTASGPRLPVNVSGRYVALKAVRSPHDVPLPCWQMAIKSGAVCRCFRDPGI